MSNIINNIRNAFTSWRERRTTIAALSILNDHQLRDIGIHRSEIISVATEVAGQARPTRIQSRHGIAPAVKQAHEAHNEAADIEWRRAA